MMEEWHVACVGGEVAVDIKDLNSKLWHKDLNYVYDYGTKAGSRRVRFLLQLS
jgi:hypothetical protein